MEDEKEVAAMSVPEAEAETESICGEASGERKRKKTLGRQKIEIKLIKSMEARYMCFSMRYKGVFNKAFKLAARCDAHVAIVMFSATGKPYSFGYPSVNAVLDRYLDPASASAAAAVAEEEARLATILREYVSERERLGKAMKAEERRRKALDAAERAAGVRQAGMPILAMLAALERVQAEVAGRRHEAIVEEVMMQQCAAVGAAAGDDSFHYPAAARSLPTAPAMLMGGDVDHAPTHFDPMMLPPYLPPPPPFNYGSEPPTTTNSQAMAAPTLETAAAMTHDAANEMEGYYGTTATCNFFG